MCKIKELVTEQVLSTLDTDPINIATEMLIEHNITGLHVTDKKGNLVGILSEKDVLNLVFKKQDRILDLPVSHYMTKDVIAFEHDEDVEEMCRFLIKSPFRRAPIPRDKKLIGIVTRRDLLKSLLSMNDMDILELKL